MSAITRWLGGEEIAFVDLVEVLFEMPVAETPAATWTGPTASWTTCCRPALALRDRLAAHDDATRMPKERSMAALAWLLARLRERTRQDTGAAGGRVDRAGRGTRHRGRRGGTVPRRPATRIELNLGAAHDPRRARCTWRLTRATRATMQSGRTRRSRSGGRANWARRRWPASTRRRSPSAKGWRAGARHRPGRPGIRGPAP